jgi:plasmid maintenance system antidote protein VapI
MESKPSERLQFILNDLQITITNLAKSLGMKWPQPFYHIRDNGYGISPAMASRIRSVYPQYSERWLIKGEGTPFERGMENYKTIAERVRIVMNHFYKSKEQFAAIIGMSVKEVDEVLTDKINPSPDMLKKIAESFPTVNEAWLKGGDAIMIKGDEDERAALIEAMERIEAYLKRNDKK